MKINRLHRFTPGLGLLLTLGLLNCQKADNVVSPATVSPVSVIPASVSPATGYLFGGNPGVATSQHGDLTGQCKGTILGEAFTATPDGESPVWSITNYLYDYTINKPVNPSMLTILAKSARYEVNIGIRKPYKVGSYKVVNSGLEFDQDGTALPEISINNGTASVPATRFPLLNRQLNITSITPEWIDGEFMYTFDKPGSTPEKLTFRIKNHLAENGNLLGKSAADPFWDFTNTTRSVDLFYFSKDPLPTTNPNLGVVPLGVKTAIFQRTNTPVSQFTYNTMAARATSQSSTLYRLRQANGKNRLELTMGTIPSGTDSRDVEITLPNFTGPGTYTDSDVEFTFGYVGSNSTMAWRVETAKLSYSDTRRQVVITKVTPDTIEGTFSVQNAPITFKMGGFTPQDKNSFDGTFKIIYPR